MKEEKELEEKPRQERIGFQQSEAAGRKAVVILFLVTVGLSLFFLLKKELPTILWQIGKPYKIVIEKGGE